MKKTAFLKKQIHNSFLKSIHGFLILTSLGLILSLVLIGLLVWSSIEITNIRQAYKSGAAYNQHEMFKYGSITGVSAFLIIMIFINIFVYWSYCNVYVPELKEKIMLRNYFREQKRKQQLKEKSKLEATEEPTKNDHNPINYDLAYLSDDSTMTDIACFDFTNEEFKELALWTKQQKTTKEQEND